MTSGDLWRLYWCALRRTSHGDLAPLAEAGVPLDVLPAAPAAALIRVSSGGIFIFDDEGAPAFVMPVRADSPVTPETAAPLATLCSGEVVDLLAFHPARPQRWALHQGSAEWLGAIPPQFISPPPVAVRRSPVAWLRARCDGLVVLAGERAAAHRILTACHGGIVAEDHEHAAELREVLCHPWPTPPIFVAEKRRPQHVAA